MIIVHQVRCNVTPIFHNLIIFPHRKHLVMEGIIFNGICVKLNYAAVSRHTGVVRGVSRVVCWHKAAARAARTWGSSAKGAAVPAAELHRQTLH